MTARATPCYESSHCLKGDLMRMLGNALIALAITAYCGGCWYVLIVATVGVVP